MNLQSGLLIESFGELTPGFCQTDRAPVGPTLLSVVGGSGGEGDLVFLPQTLTGWSMRSVSGLMNLQGLWVQGLFPPRACPRMWGRGRFSLGVESGLGLRLTEGLF